MYKTLYFFIVMVVVLNLQSCSSEENDTNDNSPLNGTWRVTEIQVSQQQLTQFSPSDENVLLTFANGSSFTGETTVNQINGRYELSGNTLTILEFITTEVADTQFAGAFYSAISEARVPNETFAQFGYEFDSQNLILVFGNSGRMVLEAQ